MSGPISRIRGAVTPPPEQAGEGPPDPSRRRFLLRAIGAISGIIAAAVAIPVVGFASASGWRTTTPPRVLGQSVAPTLRGKEWVSVGQLTEFEVGVPERVVVARPVVDAWIAEDAEVAAYVYRRTEEKVVAYDIHCTHLGCPLAYVEGARRFLCPCHGGQFSRDGNVVSGPPPRPLYQFETKVENGEVFLGPLEAG